MVLDREAAPAVQEAVLWEWRRRVGRRVGIAAMDTQQPIDGTDNYGERKACRLEVLMQVRSLTGSIEKMTEEILPRIPWSTIYYLATVRIEYLAQSKVDQRTQLDLLATERGVRVGDPHG